MEFESINGVEMVPGTVHLIDLEGTLKVKHQGDGKSDIVLIPQPTNNPNDPLAWSRRRKEYHFWLLWCWGFIAAVSVNWGGPVWTTLTIDLNTTFTQLNISSALCFLFLGVGCVILQPTAMKLGRRPVYMLGTLFNVVGCIIGGVMQNVQTYFAVNILTGFGAAPVDSLVQISTTDIFFAHERGTRLSLYIFTIYAGSYLGPVASGYIAESQSWRWCFWYLVIFFAVILAFQLFTMEETTFRRPPPDKEIFGAEPEEIARRRSQSGEKDIEASATTKAAEACSTSSSIDSTTISTPPPPKTYWQRMSLVQTSQNDRRPWYVICLRPFTLVTLPAVTWAGLVYGVQIMWLSLLATTQSEIFASDPYNFSITNVGNTNFAAFIGGIFGMFWGGWVSDKFTLFMARRNNGISEPEHRLWAMIPPAIINTGGLLMYGVGAAHDQHWILPAGFGTACIAFGIGSGGAIAMTYAVDCYPRIASESLVLMLFIRNIIGTGFTFAIQPWLLKDGLQATSIIMAMMCLVANMSFLGLTFFGKKIRSRTSVRYLRLAEKSSGVVTAI